MPASLLRAVLVTATVAAGVAAATIAPYALVGALLLAGGAAAALTADPLRPSRGPAGGRLSRVAAATRRRAVPLGPVS